MPSSGDRPRIIFRVHAVQRMFERGVSADDVHSVISSGVTLGTYPEDVPYPSRLILGWCGSRPLHVVVAEDHATRTLIVITAYEPDPGRWSSDFRRRNT